jgi:hypothetical protein
VPGWTGAENLGPTGIQSLERPFRSESLYRLSYLGLRSTITYLVFTLKLVLHETESPQLPGKFKGRENRVLRGERDEGRARKGAVRVDPRSGVSQGVLLP